jgi:ribosomal protein S18 acetylase RimI-like enzyme
MDLWAGDVRAGVRDSLPSEDRMARMLAGFDWEASARMVEGADGSIEGAVLVSSRPAPIGTIAVIEASTTSGRPELSADLTRWGLGLAKAAGATTALVWRGRGHSDGLDRLGLELVRQWWRMDRKLATEPPAPPAVAGYELRDGTSAPRHRWAETHNLAFADHWRFVPRDEDELTAAPPELRLMALAQDGAPVALTLCQIVNYTGDRRLQPVGIVNSVGTLPAHRRRGLATWLVAEALVRLHRAGARHASLYVDGQSPTRAFDVYEKVGFKLAFETEVWEARFQ